MANSTAAKPRSKHPKPKGFPLTAHAGANQWCKKRQGRVYYFGVLSDPDAALERFNREWPYILKGETVPAIDVSDGCTLELLVDSFLASKEDKLKAGELSPRTWRDYFKTCGRLVDHFGFERIVDGLRPEDWRDYRVKLAKHYSAVTLRNEITRVSSVFIFASDNRLIDKPMHFGSYFDRPSAKSLRKQRNQGGAKLFTRDEVTAILGKADPVMRAMVLLGLNCGFGNSDCATLPKSAVDLESGWIEYPRPKTEINRRIPLWPETIEALKVAIAKRPKPADKADAGLCFLTAKQGRRWVRITPKKKPKEGEENLLVADDALSKRFRKILKDLKINGRRNLGFYSLRHNFETIGGESKDQVAVDACMGHVDSSMAGNYRHGVSDERLRAVVGTVRLWLWPPEEDDEDESEGAQNSDAVEGGDA